MEALADAVGEWWRFVLILAYCGFRPGEAIGLRRRHLDDLGWLIIDGAVSEHRGKRIERDTKTHRSRIVDVPRSVLKELEPRAIHSGKLGRVLRPQRRLLGHDAYGAFPTASVRFDHDHVVTRHRIDIDRP